MPWFVMVFLYPSVPSGLSCLTISDAVIADLRLLFQDDAQAARADLDVRLRPCFLELALNLISFFVRAATPQTLRQSLQGPAVAGPLFQVVAVDLLSFLESTRIEQYRAKRMPNRLRPFRRLHVDQLV